MLLRLNHGKIGTLRGGLPKEYYDFRDLAEKAISDVYHYTTSRRSSFWTICYDGLHSKLELNLASKVPRWYLYVKVRSDLPGNDRSRELAASPISRMDVLGEDFLRGEWHFCLPEPLMAKVMFAPAGSLVQSWKAQLGLRDAQEEKMWSQLTVKVADAQDAALLDVDGTYEWLHDCGMACSSLYRRLQDDVEEVKHEQFLFLDPKPLCHPKEDKYVFASRHHRLLKGEIRHVDGIVDTDLTSAKPWRPATINVDLKSEDQYHPQHDEIQNALIKVSGRWIPSPALLEEMDYSLLGYQFLNENAQLGKLESSNCTTTSVTFLACVLPVILEPSSDVLSGQSCKLDEIADSHYLQSLSWYLERINRMKQFSSVWRSLSGHLTLCAGHCSPPRPTIRWRWDTKSKMIAYEDPAEAATYERLVKTRPPPITISVIPLQASRFRLEINVNIQTLAHRACAKLKSGFSGEIRMDWKLNSNFVQSRYPRLPSFVLKNNDDDSSQPYSFTKSYDKEAKRPRELFPEQQRSLSWAINQERQDTELFTEIETEESFVGSVSWRVAVRASREQRVRGGVFADQVGYGKTVLAMALIDSQRSQAQASADDSVEGYIPVKATLIVTPNVLIPQWRSEIEKFLPRRYEVIAIRKPEDLNKVSIEQITAADIVLLGQDIFSSKDYLNRLAFFAAIQKVPMGKVQCRYFQVWLDEAKDDLMRHVEMMNKKEISPQDFNDLLRDKLHECLNGESPAYRGETHCLSGKAYQNAKKDSDQLVAESKDRPGEMDRYTISEFELVKDFSEIKGPVLQMFRFHRLIVDEYTYIKPHTLNSIAQVKSQIRWALSGTPSLGSVSSVASLAGIIGVKFGVDYVTAGAFEGNEKATAGLTMAEEFHIYSQQYSADWQEEMHEQAQKFLDRFVRQNKPSWQGVTSESYRVSKLHLVERAHYLELQTKLLTQDMRTSMTLASGTACESISTLNEMLESSDSPTEALLKRCSVFTVDGRSGSGFDACTSMKKKREKELDILEDKMLEDLKKAFGLKKRCDNKHTYFEQWASEIKEGKFGDREICKRLSRVLSLAEKDLVQPTAIKNPVMDLRTMSSELINTALDYVDRFRRLRFVEVFQETDNVESIKSSCSHDVPNAELNVNISCGHTMCQSCANGLISRGHGLCRMNGCDGIATSGHVTQVGMLGDRLPIFSKRKHYGSKVQDLVALVKKIRGDPEGKEVEVDSDIDAPDADTDKKPKPVHSGKRVTRDGSSKKPTRGNSSKVPTRVSGGGQQKKKITERMIVFIQFPDLIDTLTAALRQHGIACVAITGKDKNVTKEAKLLLGFQNVNGKSEVLLINSAKDCAAGQ
jgi:SNF2 family DNA or RNA helicase